MIPSFSQYLVEEEKIAFFTFGRMNPPTIGHGKLMDKLSSVAGRNPYFIYLSHSSDSNKNPLDYTSKIKHARKMFPKHARSIIADNKVKSVFNAATALHDKGFRKIVMVVGSDRINEFDILLNKYNGKEGRHGFYNFKNIKVVSAGERDADAEGVEGMSASKMRAFAKDNDFTGFSKGLPTSMTNKDARRLFNDVRKGLGLKEENNFKRHVQLQPVSELREAYIRDNIFEIGEEVVLQKHDGKLGVIEYLGPNYLVVECKGDRFRCWLDDVSKKDPSDAVSYKNFGVGATPELGVFKESSEPLVIAPRGTSGKYAYDTMKDASDKVWQRRFRNNQSTSGPEFDKEVFDYLRSQGHHVTKDGKKIIVNKKWFDSGSYKKFLAKAKKKYGESVDVEESFETLDESKIHPDVVKAYKKTLDADDQASDYNYRGNKGRVTRASNHLSKMINKHYPDLDSKGKIKLRTDLQNMEENKNPEDPDIGDRKGSQPANYHSGLKKSTKVARDQQFKKQAKMDDDNPAAYKDAPGDKAARKKGMRQSKHTLAFKRKFGETVRRVTEAKNNVKV